MVRGSQRDASGSEPGGTGWGRTVLGTPHWREESSSRGVVGKEVQFQTGGFVIFYKQVNASSPSLPCVVGGSQRFLGTLNRDYKHTGQQGWHSPRKVFLTRKATLNAKTPGNG